MKSKTTKLWIAGGIMAAAFMTAATLQTDYITADAKAKKQETNSTVTYKVKGSTLTIKGSGSMSASMKFGSKKKTKKAHFGARNATRPCGGTPRSSDWMYVKIGGDKP